MPGVLEAFERNLATLPGDHAPMSLPITLLGPVDYAPTSAAMQAFTAARTPDTPDALWICEHPPVYTQGLAGKAEHILNPGDIPVVQTNRGGQVTYHGPGQVVAYPLIDLQRAGYYVKEYVYRIEEAVIRTLMHFGVTGHRVAGAPGIYVRLDDPVSRTAAQRATKLGSDADPDGGRMTPNSGPGQDRRAGHQGQPPLHLPRRGAERGDGPGTLLAHQPLRLCRTENGGPFYNRRLRRRGRRPPRC